MRFEEPKNKNYCATIVALKEFIPIPKADRIKSALIFGNSVIVSKDVREGEIGLFFPVETQLSHEFVSANNLYRHTEMGNIDPTKTGYLETHRRIKCAKFLGVKSEGLWIPISCLEYISKSAYTYVETGDTFDKLGTHDICQKYIVSKSGNGTGLTNNKATELKNSIVEGQFKFHFDTDNLRKNIHKIQPTDYISISDKWHGTSAIYSKSLVLRNLRWYERIMRNIGIHIQESAYEFVYSSRKVIKCVGGKFGEDVWGVVAKEIEDKIPASYTVYGEIVGYTPQGAPIQAAAGGRAYHYGCEKGEHKFVVYRVKTTNVDGKTLELSWPQMKQFCNKYGLEMVHEWFYGPVSLFLGWAPNVSSWGQDGLDSWRDEFLKKLETLYVYDQMCPFNNKEVPAEGVVVRVDHLDECDSMKLKNFKFLEDETKNNDAGILDMETAEAEQQ
jgi:hypothetical protein